MPSRCGRDCHAWSPSNKKVLTVRAVTNASRNHHNLRQPQSGLTSRVSPTTCQGLALPLPFPDLAGRLQKPDEEGGVGPPRRRWRQQLPAVRRPSAGESDGGVSRLPERCPITEGQKEGERKKKVLPFYECTQHLSLFLLLVLWVDILGRSAVCFLSIVWTG